MLMAVKNNLKVACLSIKYNLMKQMVNKTSFIMNILFMMLNNAFFIIQWLVIFSIKSDINGITLNGVLKLWAMSASTYGFGMFFFYGAFDLNETITNGLLDTFLVQPKNVLLMVATSKIRVSAIGDMLYGLVIMIFIKSSLRELILFIIFSMMGGTIFAAFGVITGCLGFISPRSDGLSNSLISILVSVSTYPKEIFDKGVQFIISFIIPVASTVYLPCNLILNFDIKVFLVLLISLIIHVSLAFFLFNKGLKRYSSTNLMTPRT